LESRQDILLELNEITSSYKFLDVIVKLCDLNFNANINDLPSRDTQKLLNINEIVFLLGLWLKNKSRESYIISSIADTAKLSNKLMNDLHYSFYEGNITPDSEEEFKASMVNGSSLQETIFYSGTGAYDYQYVQNFKLKYGLDKLWLLENKKFSVESVLDFFTFFKAIFHYRINVKKLKGDMLNTFTYCKKSFIFERYPEFYTIIKDLAIDLEGTFNQDFNSIGDANIFSYKPVLETKTDFIIPLPYMLAEAIYESPFYWMLEDENYKSIAFENRGNSAEKIVKHELSKVFPLEAIHTNVLVKKNRGNTITDIDVCIKYDDALIIFQVKSKKLTQLSKQGNSAQVKKDFQNAVEDAYDQAFKCYEPILNNTVKLVDKDFNILIETESIKKIYSACIVLDSYPPILAHSRIFYYENEIVPIAMSIFDLEMLTTYLESPSIFIEYITKRTELSKYFLADNELSYLKYYLNTGLKMPEDADIVYLNNNFAQYFDHDYYLKLITINERRFPQFIKGIGRNQSCFCGSGKKYKTCCAAIM
jgi:hypothetical protein